MRDLRDLKNVLIHDVKSRSNMVSETGKRFGGKLDHGFQSKAAFGSKSGPPGFRSNFPAPPVLIRSAPQKENVK